MSGGLGREHLQMGTRSTMESPRSAWERQCHRTVWLGLLGHVIGSNLLGRQSFGVSWALAPLGLPLPPSVSTMLKASAARPLARLTSTYRIASLRSVCAQRSSFLAEGSTVRREG